MMETWICMSALRESNKSVKGLILHEDSIGWIDYERSLS